jgi:hypothetical protein
MKFVQIHIIGNTKENVKLSMGHWTSSLLAAFLNGTATL